jgi:hypothetical protein
MELLSGGRVRSIRVFSAPSNTMIAAFINNTEGDPEGTA